MLESRCPPCDVERVDYAIKPKAGFLSLAQELRFYVLSFLPCRDILRCTSVCKALRQTYMSSSELQYIVELSGQRLLPVPNTNNHIPISNRLQTLKNRAHAWFKFDMHSFKTITLQENLYTKILTKQLVTNGHLYSWDDYNDVAAIIPILPKPSQQTIEHYWSPGTLCPVPHSITLDVLMDPAQNLIAVAYYVTHENDFESYEAVYVDLRTLDSDGIHPQAAGRTLLLSESSVYEDATVETTRAKLKCYGKHIALQRSLVITPDDRRNHYTQRTEWQIWDWQNSAISRSVLNGDIVPYPSENQVDFCFLGNDRLLVVASDLEVYSIADMSQTPQLLACFRLPLRLWRIQCLLPIDDIERMQVQAQPQTVRYTSDPTHQLLCLTASYNTATLIFIISTRIFFDLDGVVATVPKPWECWGPSNTRIFRHPYSTQVHVSGSRVLQVFALGTPGTRPMEYEVHLMDFSPTAAKNRRGLGRVVREPSAIEISSFMESATEEENLEITTSLPYVEVVSDRKLGALELQGIWLDKNRIYLLNASWDVSTGFISYFAWQSSRLEVMEV
ncbi:uncharacterized protein EDB93DRAFT_305364 [Suillus bovinus]|uniref:uncharacterized protein n=1 Tax=Suillus bovinus TaxID=48563 RepID=UPI001B87EFC5|nr:uncharacterized protein EDB93DRAFT_305364 [Suillus bovinus]KAG2151234.1 hypothetical protein EDB93DRAFT_305364 [Suillus bovinus]